MADPSVCSAEELVSLCGRGEHPDAWDEFVARFNPRIVRFIIRERRARGISAGTEEADVVADLAQEVYLRLLANDRRAMRNFRGATEFAVLAYLARIARAVVGDAVRRDTSQKRSAQLVSIDEQEDGSVGLASKLEAGEQSAPDRRLHDKLVLERLETHLLSIGSANPARDALVFQLHVIEGLSVREIAAVPGLKMSLAAVETVIRRTRERLKALLGGPSDLSG
jgi:RNA polymerase sigma factor (sigma-70 family)